MRETLKKYCGQIVAIKGEYVGHPKKHEKGLIKFDENKRDFQKFRDNVNVSDESEFVSKIIQPISFVGEKNMRTLLLNVTGEGRFSDILEDHLIIEEDIGKLHNISHNMGKVFVYIVGTVASYQRKINDTKDYCLVNIQSEIDKEKFDKYLLRLDLL